ncbi:MAG: hypothetical protein U5K32_12320 [Bacteroidales bacterium]|nr:hypothetical protein [Bacteroidales bacterium]
MRHSLAITLLTCLLLPLIPVNAQINSSFSGEPGTYTSELSAFMGPNLNEEHTGSLNSLVSKWDSTMIDARSKGLIISASINLENKRMRPNPHFTDFIATLITFIDYDIDRELFNIWLDGLIKLSDEPSARVSEITSFINTARKLISDNILYESSSVTWKTSSNRFTFSNDSIFIISIPESDISCYAQRDSTIIYNTQGSYSPVTKIWHGQGGLITWARAGYPPDQVYAEPGAYEIDLAKSSYEIDSVLFTNSTYFDRPVYGKLENRTVNITKQENARYPKFETYQKKFFLEDIYENIDFTGGLEFEGAIVNGKGEPYNPATIEMYRNDTLYVKASAPTFLFNRENIQTQSTEFTLYLGEDSIYHSDIAFSFNVPNRELNAFKSRFPTSRSPYYNSYHMMDIYFDYLSWKMDESLVTLSRARGASIGQAYFESNSYFSEQEFIKLLGIDDYHPLFRLKTFAEWYYNDTFPIDMLARWMKQKREYVIAMCIDLANKGFLFYDRLNNEVTIKQKLYDYLQSYAKKKDYDVMSIFSETRSPLDNAKLNMRNYKMNIEGVPRVSLSDSQNVQIFPYGRNIVLEKNRSFEFDGVVQAGMITVFGHDFKFNYDTFKIRLSKVDSIMLSVETDQVDEQGRALARQVQDLIQMTNAELLIDRPDNKSGLASLERYPIFYAYSESYVFYDKIPGLEGVYPQSDYYFRLEPFTFENTDRLSPDDLDLKGTFFGGKILEPMDQTLTLQHDNSLGFYYSIPEEGLDVYGAKGKLFNSIEMSNRGLKGNGRLNYLTASAESDEFLFFPDSLLAVTTSLTISSNTVFPELISDAADIRWYPDKDEFFIEPLGDSKLNMFDNGTSLDGQLLIKSSGLSGSGEINLTDSYLKGDNLSFTPSTIHGDSADYNLKSISGDGFAFIAEDARTVIDFEKQLSTFSLNTDSSTVKFPEVNYICTMTDFKYDMQERVLSMTQKGKEGSELMSAAELLKQDMDKLEKPSFFSTHMLNDTISFSASTGEYLLEEEKIIARNVNYIPVADALIQPEDGVLGINKGARPDPLNNAIIAINNRHIIHDASVDILRSTRYTASGLYDYVDETGDIQLIKFDEITVDSMRSEGKGYIPKIDNFMLSPDFSFMGDVSFTSDGDKLHFLGSAGIVHDCDHIGSAPMKFESHIDPENVMIPISDKPRDINGNLITVGTYISADSTHIYSAFLSPGKSWSDTPLVKASGHIIYDSEDGKYKVASREKLANISLPGSMISFDRNNCKVHSEGPVNPGLDYGLLDISCAGQVDHRTDSNRVELDLILALDFHFLDEAITIMADEIRYIPTLKAVDVSGNDYSRAMQNLLGEEAAATLKEEMNLFGVARSLPEGFEPELLLNNVKMTWNQEYQSYRSEGKIGIGFIGKQALNVYVDGFVELQKRRSGDMLDIYLKADDATWYWFSYTRGVMMALSGNNSFNKSITEQKTNDRRHPDHSIRTPYTYMIGVQDRLDSFLSRMRQEEQEEAVYDDPVDYRP